MVLAKILSREKILVLLDGFSRLSKRPVTLWVSDENGKTIVMYPPDNIGVPPERFSKARKPANKLVLPIYVDKKHLGWVGSINEDFRPFLETLRDVLSQFAGVEMEKKAILQETLEKYREINLLYKTSEVLGTQLNMDDVLKLLLKQALKATKSSGGSIMLINEFGELVPLATSGQFSSGGEELPRCTISEGVLEKVMKTGDPEIVSDVDEPHSGAKSILAVPLNANEKTLGIINLYNKTSGAFDARDEKLVCSLASQAAIIVKNAELTEDKRMLRETFHKYVSEEVLDLVLTRTGNIPLEGNSAVISVLFADIRDFTSMAEGMVPNEVVRLLNKFLSSMVEIVLKHRGTLDKYTGDGFMALYGTPINVEDHAERAISSALEMTSTLRRLQEDSLLPKDLKVGIGIHTGEAVVGNIGSTKRMEFTAIGDTVNIAARLETMTKELRADILTSHETYQRTKERFLFNSLGELNIRGKTKKLKLYSVLRTV